MQKSRNVFLTAKTGEGRVDRAMRLSILNTTSALTLAAEFMELMKQREEELPTAAEIGHRIERESLELLIRIMEK